MSDKAAFTDHRPPIVEPLSEPDGHGHGTRITHPSFGQIGASRIGGSRVLYGSDFMHNGFVRIRVHKSQLNRDLSHDWHHEREMIVELDLSEAQWATFVSSMNMGGGVPCTLAYLPGEQMPDLPLPSRTHQFKGEVDERLASITIELEAALAEIDGLGLPKGKAAILKGRLNRAHQQAASNVGFVSESFEKHMEIVVEKAKTEIHGYMNAQLHSAGLQALQNNALPLALTDAAETPSND